MTVIELKDVSKFYPNNGKNNQILQNTSLTINQGDLVLLRGDNGAGKTTLVRMISGLEVPDSGEIKLFGQSPQQAQARQSLGFMWQKLRSPSNLKVEELVNLYRCFYYNPLSTEDLLKRYSTLGEICDRFADPDELAGGQERLLHFILAIAGNPELLILDEPTPGLAPENVEKVISDIRAFSEQGKTIILITQKPELLEKFSDIITHYYLVKDGQLQNLLPDNGRVLDQNDDELIEEFVITSNPTKIQAVLHSISMLLHQSWIEILQILRQPLLLFSILAIYALAVILPKDDGNNFQYLVGFAVIGAMLTALQTFGVQIASERKQGWLTMLKSTPLPAWIYLAAKVGVVLFVSSLGIGLTFGIGVYKLGINYSLSHWLGLAISLLAGVLPIAMLGFAIAHLIEASLVSMMAMPILALAIFTSGLLPLPGMPVWLQNLIPFSPFYHYIQLVKWSGSLGSVNESLIWLNIVWMGWTTTMTAVIAVWAYRHQGTAFSSWFLQKLGKSKHQQVVME